MFVNKRAGAGFFGGEGFILQKISGPGTASVSYTHLDVYKRQAWHRPRL